ncbi:MAG: hemolysin family protein [Acidobacteria bacterium]|jgi:CBS domain containing-hemolysin-like protein|nr:hemolysin family protein [Acidobacteriota bacterium]MCU0253242.1 hemolysin family protein [Acidobacteriota bacterium]
MHGNGSLTGTGLYIAIALALVAVNAFFVAAEFALVRVRPGRLKALARQGRRGAGMAHFLVQRLDQTLSVCQVGITLTSLGLGWVGEPAFASLFERLFDPAAPWLGTAAKTASFASAFLLITFLHVVLGELVPKSVAIAVSERVSTAIAYPLRGFWLLSWPLVWILNRAALLFLKPLGIRFEGEGAAHSLEEIHAILARSVDSGQLGSVPASVLHNALRFGRRRARDAMVPRARVVALDLSRPLPDLLAQIEREQYSRYPLIWEDHDQLIGVLHVKDLMRSLAPGQGPPDLRRLARRALIVPETLTLEQLLKNFQAQHEQFAVVADEYGRVIGIITLEDVLEELVGELRDEFDAGEQDPVRRRSGGGWVLDPVVTLDRVTELAPGPADLPEGVHTVAGFMQSRLGRLPRLGDAVPWGEDHRIVATRAEGTHLTEVELLPVASTGE